MKVIVCELCESQSFAKQDGMFVCQGCGTKYTPDEAKAMMKEVEGEVPVAPTAAAKPGADLDRYLLLARRAKDSDNSADAAKYYGMAEAEDPNNWEAVFYSVYFTAMQTNIAGISSAINLVSNSLPGVIDLIKNHTPADDQLDAVAEIVVRCNAIAGVMYSAAANHYNGISDSIRSNYTMEFRARAYTAAALPKTLGDLIEKEFGQDAAYHMAIATAWEKCYTIQENGSIYAFSTGAPTGMLPDIAKYDKEFVRPRVQGRINNLQNQITNLEKPTTDGGGCFSVFLIVLGVVFLVLAMACFGVGVDTGIEILCLIAGIALTLLGVTTKAPKQKKPERLAQDQKQIESLRKQIAELEASIK